MRNMYHCSTGMGMFTVDGCHCSWFVFPMTQNDLQKYEVRIKSLQAHSEQQSKVLKRKTEEVCTTHYMYIHVHACNMHAWDNNTISVYVSEIERGRERGGGEGEREEREWGREVNSDHPHRQQWLSESSDS